MTNEATPAALGSNDQLGAELQAGYDVIAVVLGDGGHRRAEIGTRAAADEAIARWGSLRTALDALLEVAEQSVDTRRCSTGILRAMNDARRLLAPNVIYPPAPNYSEAELVALIADAKRYRAEQDRRERFDAESA